ncbi:MAG: hypothetical protein O7H39_08890 [Gammaproteobacteria bacterium]|nr:hypothetical protein [Gammaproteobacteria bacterium]
MQRHVGLALANAERLEISPRALNVIARLIAVATKLIEVGDLRERIEALEAIVQ